ncbi:MAG: dihydrolipoyl dehydrogenase family protein [Acidimicrobiia bacterium]
MATADVDTVVIGGGMAGLPLSIRASRQGRTVLVERGRLGGTCLNRGCIPTKTMIASAKVAHTVRRAAEFGVHAGEEVRVDLGEVVDRKDRVVGSIRDGSYRAVERAEALTLVERTALFLGPQEVEADGTLYRARRVVVNTGARPRIPDLPGLEEVPYLDSTSALDLRELPQHLVVVGGGYVGCEFAQMYRRFGARVTVLQRPERLLPTEDPEVSQVIGEVFAREGIGVRLGSPPEWVRREGDRIRVGVAGEELSASHLLVAAGRVPNTENLGLAKAGVEIDQGGFVRVGPDYRTSAEGVYAIGDVVGPPMFTHSARDDAALLSRHLLQGEDISHRSRLVPHAVFTDPEVGTVGVSEGEAQERWDGEALVGTERFRGVARARAMGETDGLVKLVASPERLLVGATICGPDAGNLIHELVVAVTAGLTVDQVADALHVHPTLAEAVNAAAGGVHRPTTEQ